MITQPFLLNTFAVNCDLIILIFQNANDYQNYEPIFPIKKALMMRNHFPTNKLKQN